MLLSASPLSGGPLSGLPGAAGAGSGSSSGGSSGSSASGGVLHPAALLGFGPISAGPISGAQAGIPVRVFESRWATVGCGFGQLRADELAATVGGAQQVLEAEERWSIEAGAIFALLADERWSTATGFARLEADERWAVEPVASQVLEADEQWLTEAAPVQILLADERWASEGVTREVLDVDELYATAAPAQAFLFAEERWETLVPESSEHLADEAWYWNYVVARSLELRWGGRVARSCVLDSTFLARVAKSCTLSHPLLTRVARSCTLSHPLLDHDRVARSLELRWSLLDDAAVFTPAAPTVTVRGQVLTVEDVDVSLEEGEVFWKCELELPDPDRQLALFGLDEPFSVTLGTDVYDFIRQEPRYARDSAVERKASILGASPSAVHGRERAVLVTKTWKDATLASSILTELFGDDAPALDGVLDWAVPAGRLSVQNASPIEVAQQLARATGATLEAAPDGTLSIRYLWPVAVPFLEEATEDHVFDDARDVYTLSERVSLDRIVNRVRVLDVAEGAEGLLAAEIDSREDGYNAGRTSFSPGESPAMLIFAGERVTLDSVRASAGNIAPLPSGEMEVTETLTFAGATEASLRYPTAAIDSYTWLGNDLGAPDLAGETTVRIAAAGVGVLKVTYTTAFVARRLSGVPAQLGGEDEYDVLVLVEGTA